MPKKESSLLLLSPVNQTALEMPNIVPILPSIFVQQVQFQQTFFLFIFPREEPLRTAIEGTY